MNAKDFLIKILATLGYLSFRDPYLNTETKCPINSNYKYMSSKTSYDLIGNKTNFKAYTLDKCRQIGLWHLSRHGQRYPDHDDIVEMNEILSKLKLMILNSSTHSWLCKKDLELLRKWHPRMKPEYDNILTHNGEIYMKRLGERMKQRLTSLKYLQQPNTKVSVQTTNITRTIQSGEEYLKGLFGSSKIMPSVHPFPSDDDYVLKFPDLCEKYLKEIDNNPNACPESDIFESSSGLQEAYDKIVMRVNASYPGIKKSKLFDLMLKSCQYEFLMDSTNSVWCKFFDKETLKLIEYREDIKYHCKYGYKYNLSRDMTCDLVGNLIENLKNFRENSTMLPFYAAMNIAKDKDNFNFNNITIENKNRKYKVTKMDPMNSNIAFVLYECRKKNLVKHKLRIFLNENQVKIDGCKSELVCELDEFLSYYENFKARCGSTINVCKI